MNSGFYNAAIRMSIDSVQDMEVCTENLANSAMSGYKRLESSHSSFSDVLSEEVGESRDPSRVSVNHDQGALRMTSRPLDLAIDGKGFFVVSDGANDFYTRNGHFLVDPEGNVVNSVGMKVQTLSGDLRISPGTSPANLSVDDQLNVRVGNQTIGQLKMAAVEDESQLQQAGTTLFLNNDAKETDPECTVLSGYLEQSNTGIFEEMVGMMTTMRNYEACQKMLRTVDDVEKQMMSKLA